MSRFDFWMFHIVQSLVCITGLLYGWFKYFSVSKDEFALINHPLQASMHHWHILMSPFLVFFIGYMWHKHILFYLKSTVKRGRISGLIMACTFAPMALSGYGVQVCVEDLPRLILAWIHGISSLVWFFSYGCHVCIQICYRSVAKTI